MSWQYLLSCPGDCPQQVQNVPSTSPRVSASPRPSASPRLGLEDEGRKSGDRLPYFIAIKGKTTTSFSKI